MDEGIWVHSMFCMAQVSKPEQTMIVNEMCRMNASIEVVTNTQELTAAEQQNVINILAKLRKLKYVHPHFIVLEAI